MRFVQVSLGDSLTQGARASDNSFLVICHSVACFLVDKWYDIRYEITVRYFIVLVRYENDREVRYEGTVLNIFLGTNYEKSIVPYRTACSGHMYLLWLILHTNLKVK